MIQEMVIVGFCMHLKTTTLGKQQCREENPKSKQASHTESLVESQDWEQEM